MQQLARLAHQSGPLLVNTALRYYRTAVLACQVQALRKVSFRDKSPIEPHVDTITSEWYGD